MSTPIKNIDKWLESNGIKRKWADSVASQAKQEYPHLADLLKGHYSNRPELDLVLMVHHVLNGRFPLLKTPKA